MVNGHDRLNHFCRSSLEIHSTDPRNPRLLLLIYYRYTCPFPAHLATPEAEYVNPSFKSPNDIKLLSLLQYGHHSPAKESAGVSTTSIPALTPHVGLLQVLHCSRQQPSTGTDSATITISKSGWHEHMSDCRLADYLPISGTSWKALNRSVYLY